jgi:PPOX class probable F420-dependent enzyme
MIEGRSDNLRRSMPLRLPDRIAGRLIKAGKRPMDSSRSSQAASILDMPVQRTGFDALAGHTHMLLVTYKRDGTGVPTPVWFAHDGERVYVWTEINAYKAKRVRRDPRALLAPCGPTGKPLGPPIAASGRVLSDETERRRAAAKIRSQWGLGRRLFEFLSRPLTDVHYIEFVPAESQPGTEP